MNFNQNQYYQSNHPNPNNLNGINLNNMSLRERLYRSSSKKGMFQQYPQENPIKNSLNSNINMENPIIGVEKSEIQQSKEDLYSESTQNRYSYQESMFQDNSSMNNFTNIGNLEKNEEIEEDPAQRDLIIIERLHYIEQAEPVKLEVLRLLMDRNRHPDCQLLRELKKHRYMGTVALGMILYNLIETFGADMIIKKYEEGNDIYYISERFSSLLEKAFNI